MNESAGGIPLDDEVTVEAPELVARAAPPRADFWLWVLCLLGVDYFSTLCYQPSITFQAAGFLGPIATVVVVCITLFGVLPVYTYLARHSPHGEGVAALLERLVPGWVG